MKGDLKTSGRKTLRQPPVLNPCRVSPSLPSSFFSSVVSLSHRSPAALAINIRASRHRRLAWAPPPTQPAARYTQVVPGFPAPAMFASNGHGRGDRLGCTLPYDDIRSIINVHVLGRYNVRFLHIYIQARTHMRPPASWTF